MNKTMRKILCLLLCAALLFPVLTFSEDTEPEGFDVESLAEDYWIVVNIDDPLTAVCELEHNPDEQCYPASTTKILTCILAIENGDMQQRVKIPASADSNRVSGSVMGIHKNETWSFEDLVYGMMLPSGNDAATAVAIAMAGSLDSFSELMNAKAAEIGMEHSHFVTPSGLHREEHYTTARDMALLAAYAMQNKTFRTIVATKERTVKCREGRSIVLRTSNRFLRNYYSSSYTPESVLYSEAIGIKTGETNAAGKCLVAAAQRSDTVYIAVLLHGTMPPASAKSDKAKDPYSTKRYKDARKVLEYAFEHDTKSISVADLLDRGLTETMTAEPGETQTDILFGELSIDWDPVAEFTAPVYAFPSALLSDADPNEWLVIERTDDPLAAGEYVGTASVVLDDVVYFTAPIRCTAVVTPSPTPSPSPTPEPTPVPTAAPDIPVVIETLAPAPSAAPFWSFLSCAPKSVQSSH